jgi:hypothetical protein
MSPSERYLVMTTVLGPYTVAVPGVSVCGRAALHEASGLDLEDFDRLLCSLEDDGALWTDVKARLFAVPAMIAVTPPANPNEVRAWRKGFNELIDCDVKARLDRLVRSFLLEHGAANPARPEKDAAPSPLAWILAWDPTYTDGTPNVRGTLAERSTAAGRTFDERSSSVAEPSGMVGRTETETEAEAEPEGEERAPASDTAVAAPVPVLGLTALHVLAGQPGKRPNKAIQLSEQRARGGVR